MLKPLLGVTVGGLLTMILWKALALILPPIVAFTAGAIIFLIKAALITIGIVIAVLLLVWLSKKYSRPSATVSSE